MNNLGEEIQAARLAKNITLEEISNTTRINVKYLKAIEEGNFSLLPQTYVRAFIRSYAMSVGLDPNEIIKKYKQQNLPTTPDSIQHTPPAVKVRLPKQKGASQTTVLIIISTTIIICLIVALSIPWKKPKLNLEEQQTSPKSSIIFPQTHLSSETDLPESIDQVDSLILEVSASESAWISVFIDEKIVRNILLTSAQSVKWKSAEQFRITVGNAGSTNIKLNNYHLSPLGQRGAVVRDYIINRSTLDSLITEKRKY